MQTSQAWDNCIAVRQRTTGRSNAERKVREAEHLIAALRFISQACKCSSGGVTVGGSALTVGMDQLLSVVIGRVQSLVASDKGLLEGHQSHTEVDPLAALWQDRCIERFD